jgi:hypothetical protein
MKKSYIIILLSLVTSSLFAQDPVIDSWIYNSTAKTSSYWEANMNGTYTYVTSSELADVVTICFDADTVWIESEGMTNDMGQFTNPGSVLPQGYGFKFPRNPVAGSGNEAAPESNTIGVLTNGIPIYGLGDGKSYHAGIGSTSPMGDGLWVGEAYYTEGETLDTAFAAHPQQSGAYHTHATPFRLYDDPGSVHSPLVGYANDGFPVYGPFGYSTAMNSGSGITRMVSGYELRNITDRTLLPDGSNSTPPGPAVTTGGSWDIGTFIQDYEYVGGGSSTLDEHNGRLCVTPEYPGGTYAYFVTVDAAGTPIFPYYVGTTYYGTPVADNNTGSAITPSNGVQCFPLNTSVRNSDFVTRELAVYPNPSNGIISIDLPEEADGRFDLRIIDNTGRLVYSENMIESNHMKLIDLESLTSGIYMVRIIGYNQLFTSKFIKE